MTAAILSAAYEVHTRLGPGLLESAYEACLVHELGIRGHTVERQHELPVRYKDLVLEKAYRVDLLVDGLVIVEIKAVAAITEIHLAQLLTYLKLAGLQVGLLLNFNVLSLRLGGIKRVLNG